MCVGRFSARVVGQGRLGLRKLPVVSGAIGPKPVLIKGFGPSWRRWGSRDCSTATTASAGCLTHSLTLAGIKCYIKVIQALRLLGNRLRLLSFFSPNVNSFVVPDLSHYICSWPDEEPLLKFISASYDCQDPCDELPVNDVNSIINRSSSSSICLVEMLEFERN